MPGLIALTIAAFALFAGGLIAIATTTRHDNVPVAPMHFEEGTGNYDFQQRVCPCKNDWPLGTNERELSNTFFKQVASVPDPRGLSALVYFFGQQNDHDLVLSRSDPSQGTFSVQMTPSDAILHMTRNKFRLVDGCREPETHCTPMIDASIVYGDHSRPELLAQLRANSGTACRLRTSAGNLLPLDTPTSFLAGDERNTEHSFLTSLHTLWMREHNRLCGVLETIHPEWSEEQRFWKARQVVIGKIQRITYSEWLPLLFGSQASLLETVPMKGETSRMTAEFSIVFRFGHSGIPDPIGPFSLPSLFFNPQMVIDNGIEPFLSAGYITRAQKIDGKVIPGLRDFLFAAGPNVMGEDLTARNIFRTYDLGIPQYADLAACYGVTPDPVVMQLTNHPFVGMLNEPLVPGSSLPRLIANVVAEQFRRLRENDPRFYTKIRSEIGPTFYAEIERTTLASVIRLNTALKNVPDNVFLVGAG